MFGGDGLFMVILQFSLMWLDLILFNTLWFKMWHFYINPCGFFNTRIFGTSATIWLSILLVSWLFNWQVVDALDLAQTTMAKVYQNLFWAVAYNVVAVPIAAGVLLPQFDFAMTPSLSGEQHYTSRFFSYNSEANKALFLWCTCHLSSYILCTYYKLYRVFERIWFFSVCHSWYLITGGLMALSSIFVVSNSLLLKFHGSQTSRKGLL